MFANFVKDLLGVPYELGKMDCLQLIYSYLGKFMDLPKEYKGITLDNYVEFYKRNKTDAINALIEFLSEILEEIDFADSSPGDIVVISISHGYLAPAIIAGNNKLILVTDELVTSVDMSICHVERSFKCQQ